jgi:hypothetical protein
MFENAENLKKNTKTKLFYFDRWERSKPAIFCRLRLENFQNTFINLFFLLIFNELLFYERKEIKGLI